MAKPLATPRYRVALGRSRMWDVFEVGVEIAIASFHARTSAIGYARRLAARRGAELHVEPGPRTRVMGAS